MTERDRFEIGPGGEDGADSAGGNREEAEARPTQEPQGGDHTERRRAERAVGGPHPGGARPPAPDRGSSSSFDLNGEGAAGGDRAADWRRPQSGAGGNGGHGGGGAGEGSGDEPPRHGRSLQPAGPHGEVWDQRRGPPAAHPHHVQHDPDEIALDLRKYVGIALKHRWLILGVAATTVMLGLFYTLLQTPLYRGSATIEIKRETINVSGISGIEAAESGSGAEFYQTQYELLKSRSLAERVASELGLAENEAFLNGKTSTFAALRQLVIGVGRAGEAPDIEVRQRRATRLVMAGLSIEPVRSSSVVQISFDDPNPRIAQRIANAVADGFITSNLERRFEGTAYARKFLEERLQELRVNLEESEAELVAYAQREGILTDHREQSLIQESLAAANRAYGEAEKELQRRQTLWHQARAGDGLPQSMESDAIGTLRDRRASLSAEYQDKLVLFQPAYPEMVHLQARIREIDRQLDEEVTRIREATRLAYEAAREETDSLRNRIAELTADAMDFRDRNIQYTILRREVDTNRSLYEGLLQRYKEIGVAGGVDQGTAANNISVVDRAEVPSSHHTPRLTLNLALSLMLGLMFGGAAAVGRELLDDTFKSPEEVEEVLGLPLLGVIPKDDAVGTLALSLEGPRSAIGEAFRSLRTALQFSTVAGVPPTLLVTSTQPGEGKSMTALSVARNFARLGIKVLLVDADLRKPSLHRLIGCDGGAGLTNVLTGGAMPPQVFQFPEAPNLTFLPSGPLPPNPAELLASGAMASFLSIAREKFDLVILDAPPVGGLADAPILGSLAAGTLVVVEAHRTYRKRVITALKRLHFAHAELIGVSLNKFDVEQSGYGYGYGYGDYGYYGYGTELGTKEAAGQLQDGRDG